MLHLHSFTSCVTLLDFQPILQEKEYFSFRPTFFKELVVILTYSRFRHKQIFKKDFDN